MKTINCIDFFAGIGAWKLGCKIVNRLTGNSCFETIEFIEINPFAQKLLRSHYPIPIHEDVRNYQPIPGIADVYFISFPCTGTSIAGKRTGLEHPESNLWYESLRCICIGKPKFIVLEQPEGFINRGLRAAIAGFRLAGYQTEIELISAAELGAPHKRSRVFVIAYRNDLSIQQRQGWCRWDEQIRSHIAIARTLKWEQETQPQVLSLDDGFSDYLFGLSYNGWWNNPLADNPVIDRLEITPSLRREMINLIGRSIVPLQAAIALMRIQYLALL